jgi:integrase
MEVIKMDAVQPIKDRKKIDDMKKYLSHNKRNYFMFVLGINCPLRISDLLELQLKDIVNIKGKPLEYIRLRESKTKKNNLHKIPKSLHKEIKEYLEYIGFDGNLDRYLFCSRKGENKPINRQMAWKALKKAAVAVGIEDVGTHTLRKTWGYHAYKLGRDITLIQKKFLHSCPSITLRYIGITQEDIDRLCEDLNL